MSNQTQLSFVDEDGKHEFHNRLDQFQKVAQLSGREGTGITALTGLYSQLPKRLNKQIEDKLVIRKFKASESDSIELVIRPATLYKKVMVNGSEVVETRQRYPSIKEDRVEDILGYIACQGGIKHTPDTMVVGVYFTMKEIKKKLKSRLNISYSHAQIAEALDILSNSSLSIQFDSQAKASNITNPRIGNLVTNTKEMYMARPDSKCYCELHKVFARDILMGQFYAHDLALQAKLKLGLSIDLFRRLSVRYRNASKDNTYHLLSKDFLSNTPTGFNTVVLKRNWPVMRAALKELKDNDIISDWEEDVRRAPSTGGSKEIIDIKFILHAGSALISLQKLSHKSDKEAGIKRPVVKSNVWKPTKPPRVAKSYDQPIKSPEVTDNIFD
jgi:hypothetical protein